jgi:diguanylate cyclase (GGDEF)-like protein
MSAQQTRVTKLMSLRDRITAESESCLVQVHGPSLGRRYVLDEEELSIGRDDDNHIVVDLDNVSRNHAKISARHGRFYVSDMGSTNGTYLNDEEVTEEAPLRSGDFVKVGGAIFKFLSGGNIETLYHEEIYQLTIVDGLTQISNKRYFSEFLEKEMGRCHRYARDLTLIIFDIDHFKKVNDEIGHIAGDFVLREMAQRIRVRVRKEECFARYGGEEFALAMPEVGLDRARQFAEKLRRIVAELPFLFEDRAIQITISLGVAVMSRDMSEPEDFVKAADARLYEAKNTGRNRVAG